ncbi:hypothetical protein RGI145_12450 [Roseomonas gilardii]|uniref:ClpX-type ZB domain-containing protein n=1 Tax=Roseomonas gilardii TaxID=257708 RepID=A0A1L7AGA0_9PROT|nr:hypothetical protein RGI145_12450 [Roseomonas gilardii]
MSLATVFQMEAARLRREIKHNLAQKDRLLTDDHIERSQLVVRSGTMGIIAQTIERIAMALEEAPAVAAAPEKHTLSNAEGQAAPKRGNTLYCSFCGKSQHEARRLMAGPGVNICDECVDLCVSAIKEKDGENG